MDARIAAGTEGGGAGDKDAVDDGRGAGAGVVAAAGTLGAG